MALISYQEAVDDGYSRYMPVREFDNATLRRAKEVFSEYKERGVIVSGDFEGSSWTFTDEARKVGLVLITFEGGTKKAAMKWIGCSYPKYVQYVKAYLVFCLGEVSLSTMQELNRFFNGLAVATSSEAVRMPDHAHHAVSLLQLIPGSNEERDAVIETLEDIMERRKWKKKPQRKLADFKSYLRFNDVLASFWDGADEKQKLFYFPLYFWWNLTAVLPLRPMEFLLTPRKCLRKRDGEHVLTIRRTKLKGGNGKLKYRIADDYELKEYAIHWPLAAELQRYMDATESEARGQLDTLFVQRPHHAYLGHPQKATSRYYTRAYLATCLRHFYSEIVEPGKHDISFIRFGDTRHIAMTSLMLSGGSPTICRELAGHANIDISSHYYSNISNLVRCATIERYRKLKGTEATMGGTLRYPVTNPPSSRTVTDGRCASPAYQEGGIEDCLAVVNDDGHIGDCRICRYFLPDNPGAALKFRDTEEARQRINADSRYLIRMIELVRKGLGHTEDIGFALLRLQRSSEHYSMCLWKGMERGSLPWQDPEK